MTEDLARRLLEDRIGRAQRERRRKTLNRREPAVGANLDPFPVGWQHSVGGNPGYLPKPMRIGPRGFFVACKACGTEFESVGLAYCSNCMEMPAEERRQMKPAVSGRPCQAPGCDKFLPRKARASTRFCSAACRMRAQRYAKPVDVP